MSGDDVLTRRSFFAVGAAAAAGALTLSSAVQSFAKPGDGTEGTERQEAKKRIKGPKQDYFSVVGMQPIVHSCANRREIREKNLKKHLQFIDFFVPVASGRLGAPARLVVFPEFSLHGIPQKQDGSWNGVAIDIPGEETELLGKKAREHNIYIASHAWTEYPDLPGRPMSVGFLIDPDGEVILRQHKIVPSRIVESASASPGDVYDWFVKKFGDGLDAFFPVADTELGKIGCLICGDAYYPEVPRGLAMNGAEFLVRPNAFGEPLLNEPSEMLSVLIRSHAFLNMCYVVDANPAQNFSGLGPTGLVGGKSQIVDYMGRVIAEAEGFVETAVMASVHMDTLRRHREEAVFGTCRYKISPNAIFRQVYEKEVWPRNTLLDPNGPRNYQDWLKLHNRVVEQNRDIFTPSRKE